MNSSEKIRKYFSSPGYGPKEIFESKPYDGIKADIFSLGVILFYIVTNKSIFYDPDKFKPYINNKYKKYINQDKFYKLIIERKNNDYWNIVVGEELHLTEEFKDLVINMIAYEPEERFSLNQIINHPWFEEINNLTDEEKIKLEKNVKEELEEILEIKNQNNENNFSNKKCLFDENQMEITVNKSITDKIKEDIFNENFELKEINEENLDMKNYFKINGEISPKKFMNLLYYKLSELENNKGNDNRIINIEPTGKGFEIDIKFESDNEEIIEEFEEDGIEVEEIEDYLNQLDLTIRVKLFKAQNGHLIKVFRKNGTYEDFNFYLGKIMKLIKELFDDI
jgi:serine/threonine protein kinase